MIGNFTSIRSFYISIHSYSENYMYDKPYTTNIWDDTEIPQTILLSVTILKKIHFHYAMTSIDAHHTERPSSIPCTVKCDDNSSKSNYIITWDNISQRAMSTVNNTKPPLKHAGAYCCRIFSF